MIFNSTDLRVPSEENATSGLPSPCATETFLKYLEKNEVELANWLNQLEMEKLLWQHRPFCQVKCAFVLLL